MTMTISTEQKHVILGAGGIIGRTLTEALRARGHAPRLVDRIKLDGEDAVAADLLDLNQTREAVRGGDVVHFAVGLPYDDKVWVEQFPPMMANVIAAVRETGARLVFMDNVYLYGPVDGVQTEATAAAATTRKGGARRDLVEQLQASDIDWVIARSADFYGPGANTTSVLNLFVLANLKAGKPAAWLGGIDWKHSFTYTRDIAAAMVLLAAAKDVSRTVWHVPTAPARSLRELAESAARQLGGSAPAFHVLDLPTVLEYAKGDAAMHATSEMFYQFDRDYVVGSGRFEERFGLLPTPLDVGIAASLAALPDANAASS
jgi:nucleoside-diphosphate-sugar epimerase